jgi:hypothetical protein
VEEGHEDWEEEEHTYSSLHKLFQMSLCQVVGPFATYTEALQLENGMGIGGVIDRVVILEGRSNWWNGKEIETANVRKKRSEKE